MPFEIPADLHADLVPVAWLLGTWHGDGHGDHPTEGAYTFEQEVIFAHDARAFLHYFSRTWRTNAAGERVGPGDLETGFLRVFPGEGRQADIELVLTQPTGHAEVSYGTSEGPRITLSTDLVARTATAREVTALTRMYGLVEGSLMYAVDRAVDGHDLKPYMWGRLERA
jgi:hypothetical protein